MPGNNNNRGRGVFLSLTVLLAFLSFWSGRRTISRFFFLRHISVFGFVVSDDRVESSRRSAALLFCSAGHRIKTTLFASDCAIVGLDETARASSPLVATRTVSAREFRSLVWGGNAEIEALLCSFKASAEPNRLPRNWLTSVHFSQMPTPWCSRGGQQSVSRTPAVVPIRVVSSEVQRP